MDEKGGEQNSSAAVIATAAAGGCGCLALPVGVALIVIVLIILGGLTVILFPLVVIILFFMGQPISTGAADTDLSPDEARCEQVERIDESSPEEKAARAQEIFLGDGQGRLELSPSQGGQGAQGSQPCTVPKNLFKPITDAGSVCDVIGPITIAAQIQYESQFNADFVGPNGARGISQVPTDVFTELKGDADPFDAEESIEAQAEYLCSLAEQAQQLIDSGQATGNVLDLALTAYDVGIDAVRAAGGIPATDESQSYVVGVRSWFAPMEGVGRPPRTIPAASGLADS
ncbi:lytic transglycosylase domain-containing protein [Streptomyces chartreusis]|uniref:lytic transglycosylase domain-containing protein n=1 Tax=Streptomyces chartreusis TaxID=1969 RepID=UPI0036B0E1AF